MSPVMVIPVGGLPEITADADLAGLIAEAATGLADGDIVVVTSKIVSKAEGRAVRAGREDAIDAETVRVVARRGQTRIAETRHGLVLAAAGVDASNTPPGTVVLLPEDPDDSARRLRKGLQDRLGVRLGVLVTDTLGRPWRTGQTDAAIGAAGVAPLVDYRGTADTFGTPLEVTVAAVADEIAGAADLVKGKTAGIPVAVVRGLADHVTEADGPGARALVRAAVVDKRRHTRCADRSVRLPGAPGAAQGVSDKHPKAEAQAVLEALAQSARRTVGVLGEQHHGARRGVGGVHAGRREDQSVPGLRDRGLAAAGHHADRLRVDGVLPAGPDDPPLRLADDLGRDDHDVAVGQAGGSLGDQPGQVRAGRDLWQPADRDNHHEAHARCLPRKARARSAAAPRGPSRSDLG